MSRGVCNLSSKVRIACAAMAARNAATLPPRLPRSNLSMLAHSQNVVAVGRAALKEFFLETRENVFFGAVLFSIGIRRREADIEPHFCEQVLFDADNHR